ncbi:TPA: ParB/RepB/Spo0J family partition protein [Pseudomonas aeruginosa]
MENTISELMAAGREDQASGEVIHMIHRSRLKPSADQDRDDWDSPATLANIESIRKSSQIKLDSGRYYGIRNALWIEEAGEDGTHTIIAGECRWRSTENAPEEIQLLPCIIRKGTRKELRMDHTAENGARKGLTLWQTARSILRDKEEFGLKGEEIIAVHGLTSKTQLSKFNAIHKLSPRAQELVKAGHFEDVNLVYEIKDLADEQLDKLEKKMAKGVSFQQALKAVKPKDPKEGKGNGEGGEGGEGGGGGVSDSETSKVSLPLSLVAAKALGELLDVPNDLDPKALKAALIEKIQALIPEPAASGSDNEGAQ